MTGSTRQFALSARVYPAEATEPCYVVLVARMEKVDRDGWVTSWMAAGAVGAPRAVVSSPSSHESPVKLHIGARQLVRIMRVYGTVGRDQNVGSGRVRPGASAMLFLIEQRTTQLITGVAGPPDNPV